MTRNLISAIALVSAMTLSGAAMAQTMVGGVEVSADDLPKVQAACATLAADERSSMASTSDSDAGDETEGTSTDASSGDTDAGIDNVTTSIDLALLTYESCTEAGLVE
jgi:uncharacterized low-complexity protein